MRATKFFGYFSYLRGKRFLAIGNLGLAKPAPLEKRFAENWTIRLQRLTHSVPQVCPTLTALCDWMDQANKPTVIIEINPWYLDGFRLTVDDIMSFFTELGYGCYRYAEWHLHPVTAKDIVEDNWVFVHPERHDRLKVLMTPS